LRDGLPSVRDRLLAHPELVRRPALRERCHPCGQAEGGGVATGGSVGCLTSPSQALLGP
jgi:hypothetical protein